MSELRWILLGIGLIVLVAIYFYTTWSAKQKGRRVFSQKNDAHPQTDVLLKPSLDDDELENIDDELLASEIETSEKLVGLKTQDDDFFEEDLDNTSHHEPLTVRTKAIIMQNEDLIVMHIVANSKDGIPGAAITKALQVYKLRFGQMEIYHRYEKIDGKDEIVFSAASMVKPGTLNAEEIAELHLPGLTLFLKLPCGIEALKAYNDMLHCAQQLASTLNSTVNDMHFSTLSREKIALQRAQLK